MTLTLRNLIEAATRPRMAATLGTLAAAFTIAGAWAFEVAGYAPCELCLLQRWAYYAGVPVGALAIALAARGAAGAAAGALGLLAAIFFASALFGAWHAGVEWGFWPGPAGCSGAAAPRAADMSDFLRQMETTRLVRCDEVAIRILGLSLAGWNAVISLAISLLAGLGARRAGA